MIDLFVLSPDKVCEHFKFSILFAHDIYFLETMDREAVFGRPAVFSYVLFMQKYCGIIYWFGELFVYLLQSDHQGYETQELALNVDL